MPPDKTYEIHAQNQVSDASDGSDGIITNSMENKEEPPPWVKENRGWTHEEAEKFKSDVATLGKAAAARKANLSGNGVMGIRIRMYLNDISFQ